MIVSASRRCDIPNYYSEWLMNRIRAGFVLTRNPMNPSQLSKIILSPETVDCVVFWTKDPAPMMPKLSELDSFGYSYYFQFTLTPYGREIEPNLRKKNEISDTFIELSQRIGRERVVWRYDPIILNETFTVAWHCCRFRELCEKLAPFCDTVVISFVDLYAKLKSPLLRTVSEPEIAELCGFIREITEKRGLRAISCCESGLVKYGIAKSSCIDKARIERICGGKLNLRSDRNQRADCGCFESIDIGAYNSCPNGCIYCYANTGAAAAEKRFASHNPAGEILIGTADGCKITERKCASNIDRQLSF